MTRDPFAEKLLDLAYGELSPGEAGQVEAHAASCEACRAELARVRETRRLMAALPEEPAPEKGERVLFAAAREAAERSSRRWRVPPWLWGATVVAASLAAVVAVSYRLIGMRPGPLQRPDSEALLGDSYRADRSPAPLASSAPARAEEGGQAFAEPPGAVRQEEYRLAPAVPSERKRAAPEREERPSRAFAAPPPASASASASARANASPAPAIAAAPAHAEAPADRTMAGESAGPVGAMREDRRAAKAAAPSAPRGQAEAGVPRVESRTFERCEGESVRRVELDPQGRVTRYVREGRIGGRRVRIVHVFRQDGSLAAASGQDLDAGGAPFDPAALGIAVPERAEDAGLDAPPRCGR